MDHQRLYLSGEYTRENLERLSRVWDLSQGDPVILTTFTRELIRETSRSAKSMLELQLQILTHHQDKSALDYSSKIDLTKELISCMVDIDQITLETEYTSAPKCKPAAEPEPPREKTPTKHSAFPGLDRLLITPKTSKASSPHRATPPEAYHVAEPDEPFVS